MLLPYGTDIAIDMYTLNVLNYYFCSFVVVLLLLFCLVFLWLLSSAIYKLDRIVDDATRSSHYIKGMLFVKGNT